MEGVREISSAVGECVRIGYLLKNVPMRFRNTVATSARTGLETSENPDRVGFHVPKDTRMEKGRVSSANRDPEVRV